MIKNHFGKLTINKIIDAYFKKKKKKKLERYSSVMRLLIASFILSQTGFIACGCIYSVRCGHLRVMYKYPPQKEPEGRTH
jgi:hypothetical protein